MIDSRIDRFKGRSAIWFDLVLNQFCPDTPEPYSRSEVVQIWVARELLKQLLQPAVMSQRPG